MFAKNKGKIGYLKKQPVKVGLVTLLMLAFCCAVFMFGYLTADSTKNIFTIIAVLGLLPVAKLIVSFIMYLKAEKYSCPEEKVTKIYDAVGDSDIIYGFDFYLTSEKKFFPVQVCVIADSSVLCFLAESKSEPNECKEHIEKYLANNSIKGYKAYVFNDFDKYADRVKTVCEKYEWVDNDTLPFDLMKNLAL